MAAAQGGAGSPHSDDAGDSLRAVPFGHWFALVFLVAIGLYMYGDRHVVTLQVDPIKASLGIDDFRIGLLQGLGVAIFAALFGYPIAGLVDRFDKRLILAGCTLVWALGVLGSGLAGSFATLFAASAIVGAGEAGLLPLTYAAVPELFHGRARLVANSVMVLMGRVGAGIVIAGTGLVLHVAEGAHAWLPAAMRDVAPWRLTFIALALPAPLFIIVALFLPLRAKRAAPAADVAMLLQEAGEGLASPAASTAAGIAVLPYLGTQWRAFAPFYGSIALLVFGMSALGAFLPAVAMRDMGATGPEAGGLMGLATLVSTLIGMALAVLVSGWLKRRTGTLSTLWLLFSAPAVSGLATPFFLLMHTPEQLFALLGFCFVFLSIGTVAFPTALQELTPRPVRARLISICIICNIVASALAPVIVGAISTALGAVPHALLIATVVTAGCGLLAAALLLLVARRHYGGAITAARASEGEVAA